MEEELEVYDESYSTEEEIREFHETFEKFTEVYRKVSNLTSTGVENETKNPNEVRNCPILRKKKQ